MLQKRIPQVLLKGNYERGNWVIALPRFSSREKLRMVKRVITFGHLSEKIENVYAM
ncbi:hypothetical protein [Cylindrospermopsis raciborskii]|uniref:hypothetical protein n=1 Tax=Cylindrospermopsis raciborskii TaxID=77022 RepID=UPI0022C1E3E0|nr:hypothetical protein [Cylindrospermopsis raciborskii]MCZ2207183.1 hypothetical protein [Cylindrospermopsis raciborskii PAMP2011]